MSRENILIFFSIVCIVILAFFLRIYRLGQVPVSPYWEEAAIGYDAYSILKTGKDHHGNSYPLLAFPSFGDYKPPLYFYTVIPFEYVFGLSTLAVRLPSVFAGLGTVIVVFGIGCLLYSKKVGLLAAFLFAIQPWSMHLSRVGFETNMATFLLSIGVFFGLCAKKRMSFLLLSSAFFGLSMYTYHSERIVAPILGVCIVLYVIWKKPIRCVLLPMFLSLCVALFITFPILSNMRSPIILQRAAETSIFSDISVIEQSNQLKEKAGNSILSRIIYHRYVLFTEVIVKNAVKNFSFGFLFLSGDDNIRHQTQEFGLLYHWEVLTLCAFLYISMRKKYIASLLLVLWVLISSIAPAVTTVSPHTLRFFSSAPAFSLMSALGLYSIMPSKKNWKLLFFVLTFLVIFLDGVAYVHYYFSHYANASALNWQYGYKELYAMLAKEKKQHERVYVSREQGRPAMYYAFFEKIDPLFVQQESKKQPMDQLELLKIGEYSFVDKIQSNPGLYATSPLLVDPKAHHLGDILLPSGKVVWSVWRKE